MKKYLALLLFLITPILHAEGPLFQHKDTAVQQEFENAYQDIRQRASFSNNNFIVLSSTLQTGATFYVSSGTVAGQLTVGTIIGSGANLTNVVLSTNGLQSGSTFYTSSGSVSGQFISAILLTSTASVSTQLNLANGSVAAPSVNFGDAGTGIYKSATNVISVTLNRSKATTFNTTGTSDATFYRPFSLFGGGGLTTNSFTCFTQTGITSTPKQIAQINEGATVYFINGSDGAGNDFYDIIATGINTNTPNTILSSTSKGAPSARTYAKSTTLNTTLSMASGTYSTNVFGIDSSVR